MENSQTSLLKRDKKKLTHIIMGSLTGLMVIWLFINVAVGSTGEVNYQGLWNANKQQKCEIEKAWCRNKLANPDLYTITELEGCATKAKMVCDFQ